jgi:hypothetical protein
MSVAEQFAQAFNDRDMQRLKALFSDKATAKVLDSPFPEERGIEEIESKSLAHMLGDGSEPLKAEAGAHMGKLLVMFRNGDGKLDTCAFVEESDDKIQRMEYIVESHRPEELQAIDLAARIRRGT